ncbi:hypothetical protein [Paenibacillus segetis]|uniref:Spo0E like sporulation regulatory protein n=1 Tax=Paenibacillus segetis TaxID=1325360 RepID=A0ABQ1YHP4_9BACL|nr:hypothetical protein [Paenibacillus segetis]GGH25028.1 hypothetical protein GCM10008013_25080 [Paenibacillus segetis]
MSAETEELKLEHYRTMLEHTGISEQDKVLINQLIEQVEKLTAENGRLRRTLLRVSSKNESKMSSKLKDALYE